MLQALEFHAPNKSTPPLEAVRTLIRSKVSQTGLKADVCQEPDCGPCFATRFDCLILPCTMISISSCTSILHPCEVAPWDKDRIMNVDIEAVLEMVRSGAIYNAVAPYLKGRLAEWDLMSNL